NLSFPWEILWGSDNFIWITERGGRISRINPSTGNLVPVYTIPDVQSNGEGGLLGMAVHPNFSTNPFVYVVYNYNAGGTYKEKVVRFTFNGNTLTNALTLIDNIDAASIHNGSRLFIWEGKLFISTGDAANQPVAQNTIALNGKILRINLDGTIPADNPTPTNAVWSWGHRNPQGLVMVGNKLFSSEHGPDRDDEINIIEKGRNFGWPAVTGFCDQNDEKDFCTASNVKEPLKAWTPTAALSGMDYYASDYMPQLKNSLLVTALKNSRLYVLKLNAAQTQITETTEYFTNAYGRLRDVCLSPEGKIYICTSNGGNDKIIEISKE
ncbi:MAG TPA: PQQ-dependent sugar dehydrogenase, partial [Chitinophagaceae bacterium]|nr:PQQ-dependent sugar dehydrogenase [Chitinophagaceae bacterium]